MADLNDNNKETGVDQKDPLNNPDVTSNLETSSYVNEAEKATGASTSGSDVSKENTEPIISATPVKSEKTTKPTTSSISTSQEKTTASDASSDHNESQGETKGDTVSSDEQSEEVVQPDPSATLKEGESKDIVSTASDQKKLEEMKKSSASPNDNEAEKMDHSASSDERNEQGSTKSKDSSSKQSNPKKKHNPNTTSDVDQSQTSAISNISYNIKEPDLLEPVLTNSTDKKLIDRLLGCVYGQALGDAYGLSTEFEDRIRVDQNYPDGKKLIPFPNYVLTGHNRRWKRGDWTDDTDQWILILDTLVDHNGDEKVFADKLTNWIWYGYPELGDHGGMGLGANVSQVVRSHNYLQNPLKASEAVWEHGKRQAAPNGAVMRCSASAFVHFKDPEQVIATAELMCKTTHFDPRCIASCLAVCLAITYILREEFNDNDIEGLIKRVQKETIELIGDRFSEEDRNVFIWHTDERTLEELNLDESRTIGYTYKCLASGFYGLRSTRLFPETLNDLIRYGGDADTNGAVCGTMYGTRHGYRALPYEWLRAMPNKKWLDQKLIKCLEKMNLIGTESMEINE